MNLAKVLDYVFVRGEYFYYASGKRLHYKVVAYAVLGRVCANAGCSALFDLTVHHINHDPSDCRLENLQILCKDCHVMHHRLEVKCL